MKDKIHKAEEPNAMDVYFGFLSEFRKSEAYRDFKRKMMRETKDWREEYHKLLCRYHGGERGRGITAEGSFWFALFTDREYNKRKKLELLLDFDAYVAEHGVRIDVIRSNEFHNKLTGYLRKLEEREVPRETTERNPTLLRLFNDNTDVYDFFLERCNKGMESAGIAKEILGAIKAIQNDTIDNYIQKKGCKYTEIRSACKDMGLCVKGYDSFLDALRRADNGTNKLSREIDGRKKEYKKILSQKL